MLSLRLILGSLLVAMLLAYPGTAAAQVAPCTQPVANPVACENSKPGAPVEQWWVEGAGDPSIQGFATRMSVDKGETVGFKVKSATSNYRIDIYRLGYYGNAGARLVQGAVPHTGTGAQPACLTEASTGLIDCGNWSQSASWTVPSTAVSGVYIARLTRNDTQGASQILFVVRDDSSRSDLVVQTSDATWQAYNIYGGNSLYQCETVCPPGNPRAYKSAFKVSYNRPLDLSTDSGTGFFSGAEFSLLLFLEANGYDLSYVSSADVKNRGSLLNNHKVFISSGHDEYWSAEQRRNVEQARDIGLNLAFFTGNEIFWKTRWEPSIDGSASADRTLVSYKDTHFDAATDPVSWTGTWRDPRFSSPAEGVTPENSLTGQSFLVNSGTSRITVPYEYGRLRMWRNTDAASLSPGGVLNLAPSTLGYEWDVDADNGFRPPGTFRLSSTTVSGVESFTDYGSTTRFNTTATHNLTLYRASSGALVFGSGTVQWAWGLNNWHPQATADRNMQQATVNLFADMGVQPQTPQPNLAAATKSTDTAAPTAAITSPPTTVSDGSKVTLSGTATDTGGGRVAGVEVSTDGGATWHPANGTANWSYSWIAHGHPSTTVKWRAVDDSGNLQTPGPGVSVDVTCPCSIWGTNMSPPDADSGDPTPVEVGVKFRPDKFGTISGLRFFKAVANTGTHVGNLWSADGQLLAQATFTGESASGWQSVTFAKPVDVQPDTTYVASYYAPNGHYAATADYFWRLPAPGPNGGAIPASSPLRALRNEGAATNGVYSYSTTSTFPTSSYGAANYWVDVTFSPHEVPGAVTGVSASAGGVTSANVSWSAPSGGGPVTSYKVTPYIGSTPQTPKIVTGAPPVTSTTVTGLTKGTTYTFTVEAVNPNGSGPLSARSNAVTPLQPVAPPRPTNVSAEPASQSARVTWTPPTTDGDSPITGYTITPYELGIAGTPVQAGPSATSATVPELANGTSYTFRVSASNAVGTSPTSEPSSAVVPQQMIFDFQTPAIPDVGDPNPVELGVKFRADYDGTITGLRFYKAAANTGVHTGSLWTASGERLAQVTFSDESASGWQSAMFSTPVNVTAGTTYVASYFAPRGHYSATYEGLGAPVDSGPLHALGDAASSNGVYAYGSASSFPSNSYRATNYMVDVMYAVPKPGQVTGVSAESGGATSAEVSWTAPQGGGPVSSYKVTPYIGSTPQAPRTVTGSPPANGARVTGLTTGTTYTFTVRAVNPNGSGPASAPSGPVTPSQPVAPRPPTDVSATAISSGARVSWSAPNSDGDSPITGYKVTPYRAGDAQPPVSVGAAATATTVSGLTNGSSYTFKVTATNAVGDSPQSAASSAVTPRYMIFDLATPATVDSGDSNAVQVGVKFTSDADGSIHGIRFFKAAANTGVHTGSLWTAGGQRLAQVTFTGESGSGWQTAMFDTPVSITANTTYLASYHAPNGRYSLTGGVFASAVDNGPLHALADAVSPNGVYAYGGSSVFPNSSWNATNYAVDVLFQPASAPGQVTGVTATASLSSANVSWSAPSTGGSPSSYKITPYVGSNPQPATTVTGSPPATSKTVTGLTPGTAYSFTVQASNLSGSGPESAQSNSVTPQSSSAPGAPTGVTAVADTKSALVSWTQPSSDGGSAITSYTVTPYAGSAAGDPVTVSASTTRTRVTGLTNGTAYTFKVKATSAVGSGAESAASEAVTPRYSILDLATPGVPDAGDASSVNLGVKFRADVDGSVTGVRFYKSAANTGSHIGSLWSATGELLRAGTFSDETPSGWQTLTFAAPVPVTAGTTYVASYLARNGHYSITPSAFSSNPIDNPPLRALANSTSSNGVYMYATGSVFPTNSWNAASYWVDVLFAPATP